MKPTSHSDNNDKSYKFRELKVYSSTDWLAENRKKYRQVFDRYSTAYVYAELSFFNKLFDQEDWEISLELKCFSLADGRKEICSLPFTRKVSKFDNVVFIREGWGNKKEGSFWKKGTYYWEAWIEGEKVASKYFYIEEGNPDWDEDGNPFLQVKSLKLYEGPYDDIIEADRKYFTVFGSKETRYIYLEAVLKNVHVAESWQCELFVKFFNDARELKGQVIRLQRIEKKDNEIKITAGWGSNVKGSWKEDSYTAEIVFLDELLAVVPFEVDFEFEEGIPSVYLSDSPTPVLLEDFEDDSLTLEELMEKLDELIGLKDIKKQVKDYAKYIRFLQLRKEKGFEENEEINIHSVFIGNPGTGKTTVAKMMGQLYKKMGLLSNGHVHVVDRVDLVGEYIGQTAPKVKDAIDRARGGVLFIDEAYSLARSLNDSKDFGREVIEILVKEMSDGKGDLAVIVAGYPEEMKNFLNANPGLKSRFKIYYKFSDYLPQELSRIGDYACLKKGITFTLEAKAKIDEIITEAYRNRDKTFGNARFVFDIIEKAKVNLGLRVMANEAPESLDNQELEVVELHDVEKIEIVDSKELPDIPVDEDFLRKSLEELNHLVGLEKIKEQINDLVHLVRYYRESKKDVLKSFSFHTAFIGNPGTGKTTIARILSKIYKALGVLERGHMVETDRHGLVAGYVGQTALKTAEKINEAMGGVLFIDEAYALTMSGQGAHGDFGDEAIQTILKRMEDHRGEFFIFVAGYTDNMEAFLKANPGLSSRFDKVLKFEDYSPKELLRIALLMLDDEGVIPSPRAKEHLEKYLEFIHGYRDKYFGNARTVRNIITEAIKNQNLRLAALSKEGRKEVPSNLLVYADVVSFKLDSDGFVFNKKGIGFRRMGRGG